MKKILIYQESEHRQFEKTLSETIDTLKEAQTELKKQGVTGVTLEMQKSGEFVEIFNQYHKKQQGKDNITKHMLFDKYLELYGYETEKLKKLERRYLSQTQCDYPFYASNDSFYKYCESHWRQKPQLKEYYEKAPNKKVYRVFDFLTIDGNKCHLEVPKEFFTLYSTSRKQFKIIDNVKTYVRICKELDVDYDDILKPIEKYLDHFINTWAGVQRFGLSRDLNEINFDFRKLLTYK